MSRIGSQIINIPEGVTVNIDDNLVTVTGPKGELAQEIQPQIKVQINQRQIQVVRKNNSKLAKSLHGLTRSLITNMIQGVTQGYQKTLELVGTGYRVSKEDNDLKLTLGFSHPVSVKAPAGIKLDIEGNKKIIISGINKQQVGQVAAEIRCLKKPEPYKGKGIRYQGEQVRRKPGKAAKVGVAATG